MRTLFSCITVPVNAIDVAISPFPQASRLAECTGGSGFWVSDDPADHGTVFLVFTSYSISNIIWFFKVPSYNAGFLILRTTFKQSGDHYFKLNSMLRLPASSWWASQCPSTGWIIPTSPHTKMIYQLWTVFHLGWSRRSISIWVRKWTTTYKSRFMV